MRAVLLVVLLSGCGAAVVRPDDGLGERRVALLRDDLARLATPVCAPLPVDAWAPADARVIAEATTCRYRVTWTTWSPPRDYDYVPDHDGWITDYFIAGAHGLVSWNLRTGEAIVRPYESMPLDRDGAMALAAWARDTIFPGIALDRVTFEP